MTGMRLLIFCQVLILFFKPFGSFSQEYIQYHFDFKFNEGVYMSYDEFKQNNPSISSYKIIYKDPLINTHIADNSTIKRIIIWNDAGSKIELKPSEVWGVSRKSRVYIIHDRKFCKLLQIGLMTYFEWSYKQSNYDLYYYRGIPSGRKVIKQKMLLNYLTGEVSHLKLLKFTPILKFDDELYQEFESHNDVMNKNAIMISYLLRFNDRNPIYFPVNSEKVFQEEHAEEIKFD